MYPPLITHCCFDKQLDELWRMFNQDIQRKKEIATHTIPVEPEVILSKFIEWLVWESPNAIVTLHLDTFTETLAESLDALFLRKTTPVGMPSAPLVAKVLIDLPLLADESSRSIADSFCSRHSTATYTISQGHGKGDTEQLKVTSARGQFRCGIPITNIIEGNLCQTITTEMRKLTFTCIRSTSSVSVPDASASGSAPVPDASASASVPDGLAVGLASVPDASASGPVPDGKESRGEAKKHKRS